MIEISPALNAFIETYSGSTTQLNAMAGALFAGAAFLTVRAAGVIRDDDVPLLKWQWMPVAVMVLAAISMVLGYFIYGQTSYFYSAVYRFDLNGAVADFPEGSNCHLISDAQNFFDDCIREKSLSTITSGQLGSVILSGVTMLIWFSANLGRKK